MSAERRKSSGTRWRLWSFRLFSAVAFPLAVLLGLEAILRVAGYGNESAFTVPCAVGEHAAVCDNPRFTWRFFPPKIARTAPSFAFPAEKKDGTYRIFVLGGSAAQGDPDPTSGFARILPLLLHDRYRGIRFEVINAAITAVNSHVVRLVAGELSDEQGDLFIVYLGNNEVVGPYGPGSVFLSGSSSLAMIRSSIFLRGTRLGQFVRNTRRTFGEGEKNTDWRGMEFFLENNLRRDDARMETVYAHFRKNLNAISNELSESGAGVMLCTVGVNSKDSAPFASQHRKDLTEAETAAWERAYRSGLEAAAGGRHEEAESAYDDAERIDASFADLQFHLGRSLFAFGRTDEGRARFLEARDLDTLRFRADGRINEIIRSVAADLSESGVHLLDAEQVLESEGPYGALGDELFHDHAHLNFHANYVVARAMLAELSEILPEWIRSRATEQPPLTEEECLDRLAHTGFDRHRVASLMLDRMIRPPFTNQSDHQSRIGRLREQVAGLGLYTTPQALLSASQVYEKAIRLAEDDPWLRFNHATLLGELEDHGRAATELQAFLRLLPQDIQGRERFAATLAEQGRFDEAVAECRITIERAPHQPTAYYTMAYALANLGRLDDSVSTYRRLLEIDPGSWGEIYNEIGRIEIHRNRLHAAIETYEEAIRRGAASGETRMPDTYFNYGFALKRAGDQEQARSMFGKAASQYREELEVSAGSVALHMALGSTLVETGELQQASQHFREAARLQPATVAAHVNLVRCLQALGLDEAAVEAGLVGSRALEAEGRFQEAERLRQLAAGQPAGSTGR